jgi:hypothetical protein
VGKTWSSSLLATRPTGYFPTSAYWEMRGDATLFAREDAVEAEWRVVDGVLGNAALLYEYEPGTWDPAESDRVSPSGGWHQPASPAEREP